MGRKKQNKSEHPAYAYMLHEACGFLTAFRSDLELHDRAAARALFARHGISYVSAAEVRAAFAGRGN